MGTFETVKRGALAGKKQASRMANVSEDMLQKIQAKAAALGSENLEEEKVAAAFDEIVGDISFADDGGDVAYDAEYDREAKAVVDADFDKLAAALGDTASKASLQTEDDMARAIDYMAEDQSTTMNDALAELNDLKI